MNIATRLGWIVAGFVFIGLILIISIPISRKVERFFQDREVAASMASTVDSLETRIGKLEAHARALKQDIDSCHSRVDVVEWQLGIVASTQPGRARPPTPQKQPIPRPEIPEL